MPLGWSLELTELGIVNNKENKDDWERLFGELEEPDEDGAVPLLNSLFSAVIEWLLAEGRNTFTKDCVDKFIEEALEDGVKEDYRKTIGKIVGLHIWRC